MFLELADLVETDRLLLRADDDGTGGTTPTDGELLECFEDDNEEFIELPLWIFEDC